jgi:hypothetical protein
MNKCAVLDIPVSPAVMFDGQAVEEVDPNKERTIIM